MAAIGMKGVVAELETADDSRIKAMVSHDVDAAAPFYGDDLVYMHAMGKKDDKKSLLANLASGPVRYRGLRRDRATTRVYGDAGFMMGEFTAEVTVGGENRTVSASFLSVWERRAPGWQMIAWQATPLPR
jgi:ketosteroid isomerase-like protein